MSFISGPFLALLDSRPISEEFCSTNLPPSCFYKCKQDSYLGTETSSNVMLPKINSCSLMWFILSLCKSNGKLNEIVPDQKTMCSLCKNITNQSHSDRYDWWLSTDSEITKRPFLPHCEGAEKTERKRGALRSWLAQVPLKKSFAGSNQVKGKWWKLRHRIQKLKTENECLG